MNGFKINPNPPIYIQLLRVQQKFSRLYIMVTHILLTSINVHILTVCSKMYRFHVVMLLLYSGKQEDHLQSLFMRYIILKPIAKYRAYLIIQLIIVTYQRTFNVTLVVTKRHETGLKKSIVNMESSLIHNLASIVDIIKKAMTSN